jgi:hypothetical protein
MALVAHYFPVFETLMGTKAVNLTSDTINAGLIASSSPAFTWGATPEGYEYVSQFLAGDGTHGALTEVSGGGYTRISVTGLSLTSSGEVVTFTCSNPSWSSVTFVTTYGFLYDASVGSGDSSHPIICYWDFNGAQTVSSSTFTLNVPATGLVQWTAS